MNRNMSKNNTFKHRFLAVVMSICMLTVGLLTGCGDEGGSSSSNIPDIEGLTYESTLDLQKATEYSVYRYQDGYDLVDIHGYQRFLIVPEGGSVPENLDEDIVVLQKPIDTIYLAATATMAMFCSMDAMDHVRMSSVDKNGWSFDEPKEAMEKGDIIYAGKYSTPDYETILNQKCDLALESTMIDHSPEVKEMLEDLGVPVLVDRSSYESDPLGRTEWIKLYGVLTDHEEEANAFFDEQIQSIKELDDFKNTEKTVAFFYFSSDGKVVIRRSTDYIPKMIDMAGARYVFTDFDDESGRTSIDVSVESFYDAAVDADYVIYNGSIDSSVKSMDDLLAKDPIMKKLTAVQNDNCWVTGSAMYQRTDLAADMIMDFHNLFIGKDPSKLKYIKKLQ